MKTLKFFKCNHCKNIVQMVEDMGMPLTCCGEEMQELVPGVSDGAAEKHVPVVTLSGNQVKVAVGDVPHPALEEHHIAWIYIQTEKDGETGSQMKYLNHTGKPEAEFVLSTGEKVVAVYEYCNIHSLWKTEV